MMLDDAKTGAAFFQRYYELCRHANVVCRHACAFNYPAMLYCLPASSSFADSEMNKILTSLSSDVSAEVRNTVALFLPEVCKFTSFVSPGVEIARH